MTRASVGSLIDLVAQLEQDERAGASGLRARDRELGRAIDENGIGAGGRIQAWLGKLRDPGSESPGDQADRAGRIVGAFLAVAGAISGAGIAGTLFGYDGTHPVNVVRVLAVFVALQVALLLATLILCLPERVQRVVPGLGLLQDALSLLSPGRIASGLRRLLPGKQRAAVDQFVGLAQRHRRLYGDVERWWWLSHSQIFALAFHAGAIGMALSLVAFTDLAFGWSTTLRIDGEAWLALTQLVATPWAAWFASAVPTPELIETTQYFRASEGHDPSTSAAWWPFLLASMLVYGLIPRIALLSFARWRLDASLGRALGRVPGIAALRDRLDNAFVETTAEAEEIGAHLPEGGAGTPSSQLTPGLRCHAIVWAALAIRDRATLEAALGVEVATFSAAGDESLASDTAVIRGLAEADRGDPILVLVKSWEPPVLEFLDFLGELRQALDDDCGVVVVPIAIGEDSGIEAPTSSDADQWRRALDRFGDPFTQLHVPASLSA